MIEKTYVSLNFPNVSPVIAHNDLLLLHELRPHNSVALVLVHLLITEVEQLEDRSIDIQGSLEEASHLQHLRDLDKLMNTTFVESIPAKRSSSHALHQHFAS